MKERDGFSLEMGPSRDVLDLPREPLDHDRREKARRKVTRERLSARKTRMLNLIFQKNPRPSAMLRSQIASDFGMTARSVQIWFQNKRAKENRMRKATEPGLLFIDETHTFLEAEEAERRKAERSTNKRLTPPFLNSEAKSYEEYLGMGREDERERVVQRSMSTIEKRIDQASEEHICTPWSDDASDSHLFVP